MRFLGLRPMHYALAIAMTLLSSNPAAAPIRTTGALLTSLFFVWVVARSWGGSGDTDEPQGEAA